MGQQGQNTTIRPHPSWVVPTTAPESNVHIQPDQEAMSTTALPGHQSSSEPVHQSKRLGHQEFRAFRTLRCGKCPMAPECRSTKFSKCASTEDAGSKSDPGGLADCRAHTFPDVRYIRQNRSRHAPGQLHTAEPDFSVAAAPVQHPRYIPQNGSRQASALRHTAK